jgi:hypothetical protein
VSLASNVNFGALLLARIDVTHDALHYSQSATVKRDAQKERRTSNWIWETWGPWYESLLNGSPSLIDWDLAVKRLRNSS